VDLGPLLFGVVHDLPMTGDTPASHSLTPENSLAK
jgi:hypothetical protein